MDLLPSFPFFKRGGKAGLKKVRPRLVCTAYRTCTIFFSGFEAVAIFLGNCNTRNEGRRKAKKVTREH